jgi:hypothetical protein
VSIYLPKRVYRYSQHINIFPPPADTLLQGLNVLFQVTTVTNVATPVANIAEGEKQRSTYLDANANVSVAAHVTTANDMDSAALRSDTVVEEL